MNDLIPCDAPVRITDLGLQFEGELDFDQWQSVGRQLGRVARTSLFWIGDWINYGQDRWNGGKRFERMPEEQQLKYDEAMRQTGLELATLQMASHVARRIPITDRSAELTFSHHRLLSRIPEEDKRRDWIRKTQQAKLSTRRLRMSINADRIVTERELNKPRPKGIVTHLLWINRMTRWWAKAKASSEYEDMTREQIETVLTDFEPVIAIVDDLRRKAETATAYLKETP